MSHQGDKPTPTAATVVDRATVEEALLAELTQFSAAAGSISDAGTLVVDEVALDSLDMVELGVRIEGRWGVSLRAADLDDLRTVRDVSEAIVRRLNETKGS
jgi:acyl carrier protein